MQWKAKANQTQNAKGKTKSKAKAKQTRSNSSNSKAKQSNSRDKRLPSTGRRLGQDSCLPWLWTCCGSLTARPRPGPCPAPAPIWQAARWAVQHHLVPRRAVQHRCRLLLLPRVQEPPYCVWRPPWVLDAGEQHIPWSCSMGFPWYFVM